MINPVVSAFHATALLDRSSVFSDRALEPVSEQADANTAAPGWVGDDWQPGGTLLVGINPGGGGDSYRVNSQDERLYGLIRAFRDAPADQQAMALSTLSAAWIAIQATHNIRRVIDAVLDAMGTDARSCAFINVVPFRTRNDAAPRKTDLVRAWAAASGPQIKALAPGKIVALGRKAYDGLVQVGTDRIYDVILIKRSIGDSTVTPEARAVLEELRLSATRRATPLPALRRAGADREPVALSPAAKLTGPIVERVRPSEARLSAVTGIKSPAARAAHLHLLDVAGRMNLVAEPHTSAISAIKLLDRQGRYLFSWIINAHHLLFYIRKPSLKIMPALTKRAQDSLSDVKINPAGEVTIRLETAADAERLTAWLFDPATWALDQQLEGSGASPTVKLPSSR